MKSVIKNLFFIILNISLCFAEQDCAKAAKILASATVLGTRTNTSNQLLEEAYGLCPSSVETAYAYGNYLVSKGSYEQALKIFNSKSDPILDIAKANLLAETGKFEEGSEILEKVLGENPRKVEALQTLANLEFKRKNYTESERLLRLAIQEKSDDYSLFYNLGITLEKLNRLDEAKLALSSSIRLNSNSAEAYVSLAKIHLLKNNIKEAKEAADKAISIAPSNETCWLTNGLIEQQLGNHKDAIKNFTKSLELKSDYDRANLALIISEIYIGQKSSIEKLKTLLVNSPDNNDVVKSLLWAFLYTKDYKSADKYLDKFKEKAENDAIALNNLGVLISKLGKEEEAEKYFKKSLELNPNLKQAQINLNIEK